MENVKSKSEIAADMDIMRIRLRKGMHSYSESMSIVCVLFYYDMFTTMNEKTIPNHSTVLHLIENYRTCAKVLEEYSASDEADKLKLGRVMAFSLIQVISQIVETTRYIHRLVGLDHAEKFKTIKETNYWRFRNWHTHAEPFNAKIKGGYSVIPGTKIFTTERTSARGIAYITILEGGWSGNIARFDTMLNDMRWDFEKIFAEILEKCKSEG